MKKTFLILLCSASILLSSCWDERLLKDLQLVYTVGYDVGENGEVDVTSVVPPIDPSNKNGTATFKTGHTLRDARYNADLNVSEHIDYSKLQVMLLGDELARQDIYSFLDVLYRNSRNNLNGRVGVVDGSASDLLFQPVTSQKSTSEYYSGIIESAELISVLPPVSLQTACTLIFDPGGDLYLPYLTYNEELQRAEVEGLALFNQKKFTGEILTPQLSTLFTLLINRQGDIVRFTRKYTEDETPEIANYMTIELHNSDVSIKVKGDQQLTTHISAKILINIVEYSPNHIMAENKIPDIEKWWEKELEKDSEEMIQIMKKAKSDALGIGRRVSAFHPEQWDEKTWKDTYVEMPFEVDFEVEVVGTGIID
ncbi:Ger(x)C family spore germination protein [Jeotgalibacillus sp. ET6]|uniref:Ger(x)C family spore germination protein n=1 Tax=Jeotgalibacillus sp. ET6 TaxID=3037260 RepID=UPI0024184068|nr:Ger(x)C family spore germination protein [Jeotgalibacillus sp. ET6]MDG5470556.1 Ger(x)C family spore germination protein [Jeotgalibacillus sp. ET6]